MIYIKLQNSLRSILKLLKCTQTNLPNNICNGVHFLFAVLPKRYASLQVLLKILAQMCYVVIYKEMFK